MIIRRRPQIILPRPPGITGGSIRNFLWSFMEYAEISLGVSPEIATAIPLDIP